MAPALKSKWPDPKHLAVPLELSIPTRYSLLSRLQNWDDQESWQSFFDTYWRLIYTAGIRSGLTPAEAQDCLQETILCVAKDLKSFKRNPARGSFKGWLKNLTEWRIKDQFRNRRPQGIPGSEECPANAPSPELPDPHFDLNALWDQEWEANLFAAALDKVKRLVREEYYQIFDLHVLKGWPVRKVTALLGVSVANVYVAKHRVMSLLKREVKLLREKDL